MSTSSAASSHPTHSTPPPLGHSDGAEDQRSSGRHETDIGLQLKSAGAAASVACRCENIGVGGLRVRLPPEAALSEFVIGASVDVACMIPGLDVVTELSAVVRWVDRANERVIGLAFATGLRAREVWAINQLRQGS